MLRLPASSLKVDSSVGVHAAALAPLATPGEAWATLAGPHVKAQGGGSGVLPQPLRTAAFSRVERSGSSLGTCAVANDLELCVPDAVLPESNGCARGRAGMNGQIVTPPHINRLTFSMGSTCVPVADGKGRIA